MRVDLAAAFRLAVRLDLHEGVCNHFSVMLPDGKRFLLNRYGLHWSEVTAGNLLALDAAGNVLEGEGEYEKTAFYIHSRIHLANPRATCVLHTHMPYATALTLLEGGRLEMVEQNALRFHDDIAYDDIYNGLVVDNAEGDRLARAHGQQARDVPRQPRRDRRRAVGRRGFRLHVLPGARLPPAGAGALDGRQAARGTAGGHAQSAYKLMLADAPKYAGAHFDALKRILDREEPAYSR